MRCLLVASLDLVAEHEGARAAPRLVARFPLYAADREFDIRRHIRLECRRASVWAYINPLREGHTEGERLPSAIVASVWQRDPGDRGSFGVEREGEERGFGNVAGVISLTDLNGVETGDRRERRDPGLRCRRGLSVLNLGTDLERRRSHERADRGDAIGRAGAGIRGEPSHGSARGDIVIGQAEQVIGGDVASEVGDAEDEVVPSLNKCREE